MKNNINSEYDLIVIGGGPAGLTSAIYAKRAELKVLVIEATAPGGKMIKTYEIDNYPGFSKVLGPDLSIKMDEQARLLGVEYAFTKVTNIEQKDNTKIITGENGKQWIAKAIIISTGTVEKALGVPGEKELYGHGVSYCAVCDGVFFKDKDIVVVGGGNAAIEEAIYLTKFAKRVIIVHRRKGFRADEGPLEVARKHKKITWKLDYVVKEIVGHTNVEKVIIQHVKSNELETISASAIFPYIGSNPVTMFANSLGVLDENKYIITNERMETKVKGVYAIGDVRTTPLRQIATAVGDGAIAAQQAVGYLDSLKL